jgi:hypothetical protein
MSTTRTRNLLPDSCRKKMTEFKQRRSKVIYTLATGLLLLLIKDQLWEVKGVQKTGKKRLLSTID